LNVHPPTVFTVFDAAEKVSMVVLDVPKDAVPLGTVAGVQFALLL
jgi:hypothetical protein